MNVCEVNSTLHSPAFGGLASAKSLGFFVAENLLDPVSLPPLLPPGQAGEQVPVSSNHHCISAHDTATLLCDLVHS